jgi:HEPN domain-containing protein
MPQFPWSSQQAIEKYLKAILLYNRITAKKLGHDLTTALTRTRTLPKTPFSIDLSAQPEIHRAPGDVRREPPRATMVVVFLDLVSVGQGHT